MVQNYNEFCEELIKAGFSMAGGNNEGVFGLIKHGWDEQPADSQIRWHSGDSEHDPWEWRMRVLEERDDIAYSKMFFKKTGYITKQWYPYFLAARRQFSDFDEAYQSGTMSLFAKKIYDILKANGAAAVHEIKALYGGIAKEDAQKFEKALAELQMKLFITMCGSKRKVSNKGEEYGWSSTSFCVVEEFWTSDVFEKAAGLRPEEAEKAVMEQIYRLNPTADLKKIKKFIYG